MRRMPGGEMIGFESAPGLGHLVHHCFRVGTGIGGRRCRETPDLYPDAPERRRETFAERLAAGGYAVEDVRRRISDGAEPALRDLFPDTP